MEQHINDCVEGHVDITHVSPGAEPGRASIKGRLSEWVPCMVSVLLERRNANTKLILHPYTATKSPVANANSDQPMMQLGNLSYWAHEVRFACSLTNQL